MPFSLPSIISSNLWKLATGAAAVVAVVLAALLMASSFENRDLIKQRNTLTLAINDPKTGYVPRLAQCNTNNETLKSAIKTRNVEIERLSKESQANLVLSEKQLAKAQAETRLMEAQLKRFLSTKPQGATLEDRIRDIDNRIMTELVK